MPPITVPMIIWFRFVTLEVSIERSEAPSWFSSAVEEGGSLPDLLLNKTAAAWYGTIILDSK